MRKWLVGLAILLGLGVAPAFAEGNLARRAERLPPLHLDALNGFSVTSYQVETGKYYRWRIISDGREEYEIEAEDLFENSWIDKVVIDGKTVALSGLREIEFEDEGEIDIWFIPIRPGTYEFGAKNLQTQGFSGTFNVR